MPRYYILGLLLLFLAVIPPTLLFATNSEPVMDRTTTILMEGTHFQQSSMKAVMQNAANSQTPGFREERVIGVTQKYGLTPYPYYLYSSGTAVFSDSPLDVLIEGEGFFVLQCPWGEGYSRDGRFTISPDGALVTVAGRYPVLGSNGIIALDNTKVVIDRKGRIIQGDDVKDTLRIAVINNYSALEYVNGVVFRSKQTSMIHELNEDDGYALRQYAYEGSNVDLVKAAMDLQLVKTYHDASSTALQKRIGLLQTAIQNMQR